MKIYGMTRNVLGGEADLISFPPSPLIPAVDLTKGVRGRWTSSGRGALSLVLQALGKQGVRHVHLPSFICKSVVFTVQANGLSFSFYPVDMNLGLLPDPPATSSVLFVDYFGWRSTGLGSTFGRWGPSFPVIEDASQALLSGWQPPREEGHYLILSPRKFGPTVLGGWCNVPGGPIPAVPAELELLAWRSLAARLAKGIYLSHPRSTVNAGVEQFYLDSFAAMEEYLDGHCEPSRPPGFVMDLINRVHWRQVARNRRRNWLALQDGIAGKIEPMFNALPKDVVPLGYVIKVPNRDRVRKKLAERRIYCPGHWPLSAEVSRHRFPAASRLAARCLTLPVDQRYDVSDMWRIARALMEIV